jgi:dihydroflavonol-4-reductase
MKINKGAPVLVTGATGYVAGWLVKKLLEEGFVVHAAVRNPKNKEKTKHLDAIAEKSKGEIRYFKSDLLEFGSYADAMEGCELVFHTASPFTSDYKNAQKELIEPAVNGTKNVLDQASATSSVKKVVVTSSCAAIYTDASECASYPNNELSEEIWNSTASLSYQPYSYSKTLAEKEAWKIANAQGQWKLVTINPSFVLGPFLNPESTTSESFSILKQMGDGTFKQGAPKLGVGVVDVRDLADIHFNAGMFEHAEGRNIASGHNTNFHEMAKILHDEFAKEYPIPSKVAPKWLLWLLGPILNKSLTRKFVSNNVNHVWKANNSKSIKELNASYRPLRETMIDAFQVLIDSGVFKKK